jgi:hypothetical protein
VIVERDRSGSGLYRSRLYIMWSREEPEHLWIRRDYLPLRQQVALAHEFTISDAIAGGTGIKLATTSGASARVHWPALRERAGQQRGEVAQGACY